MTWVPQRWEDIVGNEELVEVLQDIVYDVRVKDEHTPMNVLAHGPTREGKTSTIKLFARCLFCSQFDIDSLNPCDGTCENCGIDVARYGLQGVDVYLPEMRVHYLPIDCTAITEPELTAKLIELRDFAGVRLVWLDEAHRLCRRSMDEKLLKPVEERNFNWILTTSEPEQLEKPLLNRFQRVRTQLPSVPDLSHWLADRCQEFDIEWDQAGTLIRLAERANRVPGLALQVLDRASKRRKGRVLDRMLVERFAFDLELPRTTV